MFIALAPCCLYGFVIWFFVYDRLWKGLYSADFACLGADFGSIFDDILFPAEEIFSGNSGYYGKYRPTIFIRRAVFIKK